MKKLIKGKGLQKATAILLTAVMMLSVFAVLPADLFKASAAEVTFDDRMELDFNNNWKFQLGNDSSAYLKAYDDSAWETVELPHDFSISQNFHSAGTEAESGSLPGGTGWYRKTFTMSSDARDKAVILNFDGSYKDTYVYVNGELIGENHYGYNSFSFDISEYLVCNGTTANIIAVKVEHQLPSSRWYSGSGIYRDVTMTIVDPVHVDLYGTYVTTPNLESSNGADGTVNAEITLTNSDVDKAVTVTAQILDASGAEVGTAASAEVTAIAGEKTDVTLTPSLENPTLWNSWDLGSPYLYTLRTTVSENGTVIDTYDTEFGYRWFEWNADTGFSLNGKNVKLEGVCMHHDQGALGASQEYDAIYRQVMILKDMGCNAIRTSHGTPSDVFMDICNEVGMLVMDEFFDGWDTAKNSNTNDFSVYFDQTIDTATNEILGAEADMMWYEFVVTQSVKRDRNDPSVVIWDVGNELSEGGSYGNFDAIAENLRDLIDVLDSTRPICQGNNAPGESVDSTNTRGSVDNFMDVIGGNYNTSSWISIMEGTSDARSTKPYVSTETASALSTRGHYSTPYSHTVLTMTGAADSNKDINAYDTSKVSWGEVAAAIWYNIVTRDWNSGEFVWTGFDYIGEPTPYNNTTGNGGAGSPVSSYFGIIDTAGFAKDTYYLYRSMWNEHSTTLHLVPGTWDSSELYVDSSGYVDVAVYSNAARIELLGDGNVIATAQSTTVTTDAGHKYQTWTETTSNSNVTTDEFYTGDGNDFYPQFHVNHSAFSEISVKAYDADGNEITDTVGTKEISAVTATKIVPTTWAAANTTYTADGDSFIYIEYTAQDADGNFDSTYNGTLDITLNGNEAVFVGVDNGDPVATQKFQQSSVFTGENTVQVQMFNGKALVVLRTNEEVGDVEITATATDASVDGITFTTVAEDAAKGEDLDEFEEAMPQPENLVYEPTVYDEYEILKAELLGDGENSLEADYVLYSANPEGTTVVNMDIPDGWYIITGADDSTGTYSSGVLTHETHSSGGFVSDGSTGVPAADSDAWYFEKVSSGKYYIYYEDANGDKQYLTISNNQVYVSTAPYTMDVTTDAAGNVTIGFGSTLLNYSGGTSQQVYYYSTGTNLKLYYVDEDGDSSAGTTTTTYELGDEITSTEAASLADGYYVITGFDGYTGTYAYGAMTHTQGSGGILPTNSSTITADDSTVWYFEATTGGYYIYYLDSNGVKQYINIADGNITTSTTAAVLTISDDDSDGMVIIGDSTNSYQLNYYGNTQLVGEWAPGTELTIYKVNVTTTTTSPTTTTVTEVTDTSSLNGEYIITGSDDQGAYTYGATTHTLKSGGLTPSNTTAPFTADENNTWIIEPTGDGYYYIYYTENGTNYYIVITDGNVTTSTTATKLTITSNGGTAVIGDSTNTYQLNYYGNSSSVISEWNPGTAITFYKVETVTTSADGVTMWIPTASTELASPVENGEYVIYNSNYIVGGETKTNYHSSLGRDVYGFVRVAETPTDNVITALRTNAYTFTLVDGTTNQYYITNSEGKYITIGSQSGEVTLSDTAESVYVYGTDDNRVVIYNNGANFDNFQDANDMFSSWTGSHTSAGSNQIMTLYKNENSISSADIPEEKVDLYNALIEGIQYAPGTYSTASYDALFTALEEGYAVLENENATADEIANATTAINEAIAGLTIEYKYMPSTLYKYGYVPESDTPYNDGGNLFNTQTYESMEEIIRADDNLVSQIKTAIDYDGTNGTTWLDGEADAALDTAITAYAQIYSLSFTGAPVAGQSSVSNFQKTAWNVWTKTGTQGAAESSEEGASVQGLFSALLVDGQPTDHADYSELPYGNAIDNANRTQFNTINGISLTITANGAETTIDALPALQGISVHINDMFAKEDVLVDSSDATQGYAKKYWDLNFPLVTTTNEYGINTFRYSSSSTEYVFQAEFDDDTNTATAKLTPVEEWSINRDSKGEGIGFFPFNYQQGTTTYTGDNAIYHYAFNFNTDFYIPSSGTYADGEDVIFNFSGDDDVLVYIDGVLVLDNGGLHGARAASINFTDATVSYQYAMNVDAEDGLVESTTENDVTYAYGATNATANADELAALEKLNEVRTDGEYHTFSFYYVERGSTDSNCEIEFNLQQASEHVLLHDQTLVLDYGLPVEYYDVQRNDTITEEGKAATIEYLGVLDANVEVNSVVTFSDPSNISKKFADYGEIIEIDGLKYGTAKMTKDGRITYTPTTLQMTGRDFFYFCASIEDDPTYAADTVYYQYERINFIPATSIYYEDNYNYGISFVDGTTTDGSDYGKWQTVGDESLFADAMQSDDLSGDSAANPYGYDAVYVPADENDTNDYTQFSGFSAHKVTVNADNNTKNGGTNPTVEFTFKGTGFDVISVTDNKTGVFYVEIFDENGDRVGKRRVVDTYYGYSYGQIYLDADGNNTLEVTDTPAYKTNDGHATTTVTYYAVDGTTISTNVTYLDVSGNGYTETPTYYDADGNITETETENPAYAYAYAFGWVESADTTGLYQIPVIKINGLDYGEYTVVITPMYTAMFDHNGSKQFDLYVDAIRIYDPAGKDDDIEDQFILQAYKDDDESYPNYVELKDMLIGADSLSKDAATQGVIFIDGIAALDNDLEKYKLAGPNNELYLASGQAVAFEIWASQVPDEVQLGIKSVKGTPTFKLTYGENSGEKVVNSATEMNYVLNSFLPDGGKLTWSAVVVNGVTYYKTDTVVIQNSSVDDSILSITSMKWTFTGVGQYGHYEVTTNEEVQNLNLMSTDATIVNAYSMMAARNEDTDDGAEDVVPETPETPVVPDASDDDVTDNEEVKDNNADENTNNNTNSNANTNTNVNTDTDSDTENQVVVNEPITVTVTTSTGVTELIIRDEKGNVITPEELECVIETIDNKEVKVWTITLAESESGTYTYSVIGEFEDGTVEEQEEITITVTAPEEDEGFFAKLAGFFADIVEFFKNLIAKIDIA